MDKSAYNRVNGDKMIGLLVELSAYGKTLECCKHLQGKVGLIVDVELKSHGKKTYWIDWVGMTKDEAYPRRTYVGGLHLANGYWNRRDFKVVKKK